jgi:secreted trypsin-like serine protease
MQGETTNGRYAQSVLCTGTLITRSHIVTSAHCLDAISMSIVLVIYGSVDVRHGRRLPLAWWISCDQWMESLELDVVPAYNDISLIKVNNLLILLNER